jgi:hypothetical protein
VLLARFAKRRLNLQATFIEALLSAELMARHLTFKVLSLLLMRLRVSLDG